MNLANWVARKTIAERDDAIVKLALRNTELEERNQQLLKKLRETREAAKHFDWNISNANSQVAKFMEIVGLDEWGNLNQEPYKNPVEPPSGDPRAPIKRSPS